MRNKKITIAALNITMHPHSPERYSQLFLDVRTMELKKPYRGNSYGMIGLMSTLKAEEEITETTEVTGLFYRFLQFDPNEPWLNFREGKQAKPEDLAAVQIPDHLRPGYASFHFLFSPFHHRLFFETTTEKREKFTPGSMRTLVENLLNDFRLQKKYLGGPQPLDRIWEEISSDFGSSKI
uniref:Uncharacterized protein n=1 Tax=Candidatus Kentrum sp. LFY TaxID=2126342 RepID=A0A450X343_9GAMM|nr:MAG: protein of unknown function (DUF4747) [Candidatus Kentron sp. LFY]